MGSGVFFLLLDDDVAQMYGDSHPEVDRIWHCKKLSSLQHHYNGNIFEHSIYSEWLESAFASHRPGRPVLLLAFHVCLLVVEIRLQVCLVLGLLGHQGHVSLGTFG